MFGCPLAPVGTVAICSLLDFCALFFTVCSFSSGEEAFCFLLSSGEVIVSVFIFPALRSEYRFGVVKSIFVSPFLTFLDLKIRVCCCDWLSIVLCCNRGVKSVCCRDRVASFCKIIFYC